ncbi:hypothetical protein BJ878DRAFT_533755 [Calycina marina]|uniref:Uncharacterized protein n=1 Tax=Calycina marina TaxID=1763456 RepID=A0A9P8CGF2_9HELO|nr:hypothetical protein BJ878DRAFT_533755 [Calycina marina]
MPSPANLDVELFTSDVKMQIRTLHAKLIFLQETGGMTDEVSRMMTELSGPYTRADSLLTTRLPARAAPAILPKALLKAETMQAHSEYAGPDWKHLLIMPGDIVIVYAYIDEMTAVGFNTRTNLGGRFPLIFRRSVELLTYKSRQYVRVCRRGKDNRWAYGFNQSTLSMGRIYTDDDFTKIGWHKEN